MDYCLKIGITTSPFGSTPAKYFFVCVSAQNSCGDCRKRECVFSLL